MVNLSFRPVDLRPMREIFGDRLQENAPLARYTAVRVGGPADALLDVHSLVELAEAVSLAWEQEIPSVILGGGSNALVSDAGVRGLVILNRAREVRFDAQAELPTVWAESGANFGALARQAVQRGMGGLEWAAGIPGTVGGAVVGNAGAHGSDMATSLRLAEILHRSRAQGSAAVPQQEEWSPEQLAFRYRSSLLKRQPGDAVVLAATLRLEHSAPQAIQAKMEEFLAHRRRTQPPGASMGSMFKNPPGDYAGRLIEAAGLKGKRIGDAQISTVHANFFVNRGQASAQDILSLIQLVQQTVAQKLDVMLELEIELLGDWIMDS